MTKIIGDELFHFSLYRLFLFYCILLYSNQFNSEVLFLKLVQMYSFIDIW